ncbi:regulatory protein CsrD [Mangrovibacter sp. MFB070]|uniref:RNase E specificity factor CsrD n=1 Tax=Mangrovibacter sp. MFB070 TaxID=1224318 RepID=UPI0004D42D72|nr:RNase E specificity factor CsrD [Mangrovibacter sp. MFB070]KEA53817.1 regulatory protein CsrD [Mangrovibacter sp. MFB070]
MRLTTKFSAIVTLLSGLAMLAVLIGCSWSFYTAVQVKLNQRVSAIATIVDNRLLEYPPETQSRFFDEIMTPVDVVRMVIRQDGVPIFLHDQPEGYNPAGLPQQYKSLNVPLVKHPGMTLTLVWMDPMANYFHSILATTPLSIAVLFIVIMALLAVWWIKRQFQGLEHLEARAIRILKGERRAGIRGTMDEWPHNLSSALDVLLADIQNAGEQQGRVENLIRAYAAQDSRTGLNNRLFFDNQLATLLEGQDNVQSHGVVMMIRLPDFEMLHETWGRSVVDDYLYSLVNMLSTFIMRYPGALLARYYHSDFAVLLPHRSLKEAGSIAGQLLNAVDALPPTPMLDRNDMLHIGITAWRSGQTTEQVMEQVEVATREAMLHGGNGWSTWDESTPEKVRGNVRWRTLLEGVLQRGGPRIYQKPAVMQDGVVHHRELLCRIFDGQQEVLSAEYMPVVQQFGLADSWDRQMISRGIQLLQFWPEETFAFSITVDSLLRPPFQRWLRDTLMQCEKSLRRRIILELPEADVCQHIGRLQSVIRLIKALGSRVAVNQAGLTLVSTAYIKELNVELIKLHPGLVRNIEKRTENQLLIRSLVEACTGMQTRVFATGVRARGEWQTLVDRGVSGAQGDFIAATQALDTNVKKYLQRYSV